GTASQGAASAGCTKQVVNLFIERRYDLMHCLPMGHRVEDIGILIRPKTVWKGLSQRSHTLDPRMQILFRHWIGISDDVYFCAVSFEKPKILLCGFGIDYANEPQTEIGASLGQPDPHISRT